jgi:DedD protein
VFGIVALVALNAVVAGASYVPTGFSTRVEIADLPALPAAPASPVRPLVLPRVNQPLEEVAPLPAAAKADGVQFAVAVGAYTTTSRAARMSGILQQQRFTTFTRQGRGLYQVLLGPFSSRDEAEAALLRLRDAGDHADATVVPLQRLTGN